jgi:ComF family protein
VRGLKYRGWTALADYMGGLMVPAAQALDRPDGTVLVPVPLARSRLRERGFNQAELLAHALSDRVGWPVRCLLRRREGGGALAGLGREERARTASAAFELAPSVGIRGFPVARVVLVDDVVTTGATAAACAEALTGIGGGAVDVISFARTDPLGGES